MIEYGSFLLTNCSLFQENSTPEENGRKREVKAKKNTHVYLSAVIMGIKVCYSTMQIQLQPAAIGLPTGNGKKLSCSHAQQGQATGLAVA